MNQETYDVRDKIEHKIAKVYLYGSRVYKCNTPESDHDFIAVVKSDEDLYYSVQPTETCHFTVYSESMFIKRIQEHHISILECIFQTPNDPYVKHFKLDKEQLRRSISAVSSNSFGKCKKKLTKGDVYIGKKSLFHSLRILNFGIQIAREGRIVNYRSCNVLHKWIMEIDSDKWEDYRDKFQPIYNAFKSYFKKVAPIEKDKG